MNEPIIVNIASDDIITCFAEGYFLRKEYNQDKSVDIYLDKSKCVILYFHLNNHRRVYICCKPSKAGNKYKTKFYNVNEELCVLNCLTGRAFDRFKRSMQFVNAATKGNCYNYSVSFFIELSILCMNHHNNNLSLVNLVRLYDPFAKIDMKVFRKKNEQ